MAVKQSVVKRSARGEGQPLGARIAALRKSHGLNLTNLAEVCGFSEATLSRIENGQTAVSAHHLFLLAQYLNVDIADFFRDDAAPLTKGMRSITRNGEGDTRTLARYTSEIMNADLSRKSMHPAINIVTARTLDDVGGLWAHEGEEFLHVLKGALAIHTDIYAPTILQEGDSLYFDASMEHAYLNAGDRPAHVLVIVGPRGGPRENKGAGL